MVEVHVMERDGTPAVGAVVSDGRSVRGVDADGRAELPGDGPFVFLTTRTPGAPEPWFAPVGDGPVTFIASRRSGSAPVRLVHLSDLHVTDPEAPPRPGPELICDAAVAELARMQAPATEEMAAELFSRLPALAPEIDAAIVTGDLTDRASDVEFAAYLRATRRGSPVLDVPGNHDHREVADGLEVSHYERFLGPRHYSLDIGDLHVVVLDWYSWARGVDAERQREWLLADLAVAGERDWVLFVHDRIRDLDLTALPRPPKAQFTGHWHATRVLDHGGTTHVATGSPLFAGLDTSVPVLRVASFAPGRMTLRTHATPTGAVLSTAAHAPQRARRAGAGDVGWVRPLEGSGMTTAPVGLGHDVVIVTVDEDRGHSTIEVLRVADGVTVWRRTLEEPVRAAPQAVGDILVVTALTGRTSVLSREDGTLRWSRPGPDALLAWVRTPPAVDAERIIVGDPSALMSWAHADGTQHWQRRDLAQHLNHVAYTGPVLVGDHVAFGAWPQAPGLIVLAATDGSVHVPVGAEVTAAAAAWGAGMDLAPRAQLVPDGDGVLVLEAGRLRRRRTDDLKVDLDVPAPGLFAVSGPCIDDDLLLVVEHGVALHAYDRTTGARRWTHTEPAPAPLPQLPYARTGAALAHAPRAVSGRLVLPLADGRLRVLDRSDGRPMGEVHLGAPLLTGVGAADGHVVAVDIDGVVRGIAVDELSSEVES